MDAVDAADLVDLHDIGVQQGGGGLGFQMEAADIAGVGRQFALQHLERDLAAQRPLLGQIDFGHRPAPQPAQQPIIAQLPAG